MNYIVIFIIQILIAVTLIRRAFSDWDDPTGLFIFALFVFCSGAFWFGVLISRVIH